MPHCEPRELLQELDRLEKLRDPGRNGQRQFRRFVVRGEAELQPMSRSWLDPTPIAIQLRDVGRGGAGFLAPQVLAPGSCWRMNVLNHGYVVGQQGIVVRHCREISSSLYLIGGMFIADTGFLTLLGVPPGALQDGDAPAEVTESCSFVSPDEAA